MGLTESLVDSRIPAAFEIAPDLLWVPRAEWPQRFSARLLAVMTAAQPSGAVCSVAPWKRAPPLCWFLLEHVFEYTWEKGLASGIQQVC
jgi:hypothetical protein